MKTKEMRAKKLPAGPQNGPGNSDGLTYLPSIKPNRFRTARHREDYKRSLRESLKAQMQESADKRRHEFNRSCSESRKAISDFHSSRWGVFIIDLTKENAVALKWSSVDRCCQIQDTIWRRIKR